MLGKISHLDFPSMSTTFKEAWEQDLQINISEENWDGVLRKIHSSSMCARHSLIQFKVVHRAHLPKSKLSRIYPPIDPTCDRCKSAETTFIHILALPQNTTILVRYLWSTFWSTWCHNNLKSALNTFWDHCWGIKITSWRSEIYCLPHFAGTPLDSSKMERCGPPDKITLG